MQCHTEGRGCVWQEGGSSVDTSFQAPGIFSTRTDVKRNKRARQKAAAAAAAASLGAEPPRPGTSRTAGNNASALALPTGPEPVAAAMAVAPATRCAADTDAPPTATTVGAASRPYGGEHYSSSQEHPPRWQMCPLTGVRCSNLPSHNKSHLLHVPLSHRGHKSDLKQQKKEIGPLHANDRHQVGSLPHEIVIALH